MFKLFYNNQEITTDIRAEVYDIKYTDYIEGNADTLEISITDPTQKWLNNHYPKKGTLLDFALRNGDDFLNLGKFHISEISYSSPPYTLIIKSQSVGLDVGNRTHKAKSFIDTDLKTIVDFFAKKLKLKVIGNIEPIKIKNSIQYGERDLEYLKRLANKYNYFFKIHQDKIVFSQNKEQQSQFEVITLSPRECIKIDLNDYIKDTAKAVNISAFNIKTKTKMIASSKSNAQNNNSTIEKSSASNSSFNDLQNQADASIYNGDTQTKQGIIGLIGTSYLVAGQNIKLSDFYNFNGIYLIRSTRHSLSESGFTTELELRFLK